MAGYIDLGKIARIKKSTQKETQTSSQNSETAPSTDFLSSLAGAGADNTDQESTHPATQLTTSEDYPENILIKLENLHEKLNQVDERLEKIERRLKIF